MEKHHSKPPEHKGQAKKAGLAIASFLRDAREQLRGVDTNPHEGKLRWSAAPKDYLPKIPDYPPVHDDTIPPKKEE